MKTKLNESIIFTFILLAVIGLCFTACNNNKGNEKAKQGQSAPTSITEDSPSLPEQSGNDIIFKDKDSKTVSLSSLRGKVVFINFWATWCAPCIQEMPTINKLKQTYKGKDIVFIMVDVDNKLEKSTAFMKENKYDLPVYVPAAEIPPNYLGGAIPTTVILDKSGDMIARIEGGRNYTSPEITKALNELIESN